MATDKKPVKTHDVIEEFNSVWGEEHEEKRKKIYKSNIISTPFKDFIFISFIYMTFLIMCIMFLWIGGDVQNFAEFPKLIFNAPYYLVDLRSGIIASLASILLSLYVSVGKFGEKFEGVVGEARRATYRNFARLVGEIVAFILVINFWHGLLAGYLNGTSYAPELFGGWRVGPGWGKLIVAEDVNLARYGEVPLWVLLFFAWFTVASSRMLTYDEKDVLVRNSVLIQRVKGSLEAGGSNMSEVYHQVVKLIDRYEEKPKIRAKSPQNPIEYTDRFISSADYQGFEFVLTKDDRKELTKLGVFGWFLVISLFFFWPLLEIVLYLFGVLEDNKLLLIFSICAGLSVASLVLKAAAAFSNKLIFYRDIYKLSVKKSGDWWSSYGVELVVTWYVNFLIFCFIFPFGSYSSIYFLASLRQDSGVNTLKQFIAISMIFIFVIYIFCSHCAYMWITGRRRSIFFRALEEHSEKYLMKSDKKFGVLDGGLYEWVQQNVLNLSPIELHPKEKTLKGSPAEKINNGEFYLLFAYMYCSVLRIHEYYTEYKSEIGDVKPEHENQESSEHEPEIKKESENHRLRWNRLRVKGRK